MFHKMFKRSAHLDRDVTVIVRGVEERTEKACLELLHAQIAPANVHVVHAAPFSNALIKSFEIGIREKRKWTLVIDADVLPRPGILQVLCDRAEAAPQSVFAVQSEMLDKFFGGTRVGGIKVYRSSLLPDALKLVPQVDVRPETFTIKHMHKQGHYTDITSLVCGLHDFEQYYSDIFRKGFVHGIKHHSLTDSLMPYWQRMSSTDTDFKVLLAGYSVAKQPDEELKLDKDEVLAEFESYLRTAALREKAPLETDSLKPETIDRIITSFVTPKEYKVVKAEIDKLGRPTIPIGAK